MATSSPPTEDMAQQQAVLMNYNMQSLNSGAANPEAKLAGDVYESIR